MKNDPVKLLIYCILGLWGIFAILCAFFDLYISEAFFNPDMWLGIFIKDYGEVPGALVIFLAFIVFNANLKIENISWRCFIYFVDFVVASSALYYAVILILHQNPETPRISIWIASAVVAFMSMTLCQYRALEFARRHAIFGIITVWTGTIAFILVQVLKIVWGRIRFRTLTPDYSDFSPWYLPQMAGGSSFPSGHVFMGWMLLPLLLLFVHRSTAMRWLVLAFLIAWGLLVGAGRIIVGAHYASDVLFSTGFCLLPFLILYRHYHCLKNSETWLDRLSWKSWTAMVILFLIGGISLRQLNATGTSKKDSILLQKLTFGLDGNAKEYQKMGWSYPESEFTWTEGKRAELSIPIHIPKSDIELQASLFPFRAEPALSRQRVNIYANGKELGRWNVTSQAKYRIKIPRNIITSPNLNILFELPDAASPVDFNMSSDARILGIAIHRILFLEQKE